MGIGNLDKKNPGLRQGLPSTIPVPVFTNPNTGYTDEGLEDVGIKLESLTEEITKISVVTNYTDQFQNLKGFN